MPWDCHCDVTVGHSAGCGYWKLPNPCKHLSVSSVDGRCYRCGVIIKEVVDGAETPPKDSPSGAP